MKSEKLFQLLSKSREDKRIPAYPIEKRLISLYQGNLFRMNYPKGIIEVQNKFRQAEI